MIEASRAHLAREESLSRPLLIKEDSSLYRTRTAPKARDDSLTAIGPSRVQRIVGESRAQLEEHAHSGRMGGKARSNSDSTLDADVSRADKELRSISIDGLSGGRTTGSGSVEGGRSVVLSSLEPALPRVSSVKKRAEPFPLAFLPHTPMPALAEEEQPAEALPKHARNSSPPLFRPPPGTVNDSKPAATKVAEVWGLTPGMYPEGAITAMEERSRPVAVSTEEASNAQTLEPSFSFPTATLVDADIAQPPAVKSNMEILNGLGGIREEGNTAFVVARDSKNKPPRIKDSRSSPGDRGSGGGSLGKKGGRSSHTEGGGDESLPELVLRNAASHAYRRRSKDRPCPQDVSGSQGHRQGSGGSSSRGSSTGSSTPRLRSAEAAAAGLPAVISALRKAREAQTMNGAAGLKLVHPSARPPVARVSPNSAKMATESMSQIVVLNEDIEAQVGRCMVVT